HDDAEHQVEHRREQHDRQQERRLAQVAQDFEAGLCEVGVQHAAPRHGQEGGVVHAASSSPAPASAPSVISVKASARPAARTSSASSVGSAASRRRSSASTWSLLIHIRSPSRPASTVSGQRSTSRSSRHERQRTRLTATRARNSSTLPSLTTRPPASTQTRSASASASSR